jgi:hypothetical protein
MTTFVHINPKYVGPVFNGGHRLTFAVSAERDASPDGHSPIVPTHAFMGYSIAQDQILYFARDGRVWDSPPVWPERKVGQYNNEIMSIGLLEARGARLHDELWMVRNDVPSQFSFNRVAT